MYGCVTDIERYHHRFKTTIGICRREVSYIGYHNIYSMLVVTTCDLIFNATISAKTNNNPIEIKGRKPAGTVYLVARTAFASQS